MLLPLLLGQGTGGGGSSSQITSYTGSPIITENVTWDGQLGQSFEWRGAGSFFPVAGVRVYHFRQASGGQAGGTGYGNPASGGGAGGQSLGGTVTDYFIALAESYAVTVGPGGTGAGTEAGLRGAKGGNAGIAGTNAPTPDAEGGGGGGSANVQTSCGNGGNGGGGAGSSGAGGTGATGNDGGAGTSDPTRSGGGAGSGGDGLGGGSPDNGNGGPGIETAISGTSRRYGGAGAGARGVGVDGGGTGGLNVPGTPGTPGTGGGGGGVYWNFGSERVGEDGGIGCVIIFVPYATAGASVSGTSSVTLAGVTQSGTGIVPVSGASSVTLVGVTQSGAGHVPAQGASSVTLTGVSQAAAGQVAVKGTSGVTLEGVTPAATGVVADPPAGIVGSSSVPLAGVTQAAVGQVAVTGASAITLGGVSQAATAQVPARGASAVTLAGVTQSGAGQVPARGTGTVILSGVAQTGAGTIPVRGASAVPLAGVAQVGAGQVPVRGSSVVTLNGVTLAGVGGGALPAIQGAGFAILQGIVQQASGTVLTPATPPYDWAPPVDLAASGIIGQALRFMRLAPVARHDPTSELLPALVAAFDSAIDELLSAADWSFASVLVSLPLAFPALTAEDDMPTLCMLPGDLVQLREVRPSDARWRIDGAALRTSAAAPVIIRYTARITREDALPATFRTAVALRIALLLGARWAGSAVEPEELDYQARQQMKQALRDDTRHASAARALPLPDLGYGTTDGDWAMEAVG